MYTILDDLGSFFDISAGDFVPLFDIFVGRDLLTSTSVHSTRLTRLTQRATLSLSSISMLFL